MSASAFRLALVSSLFLALAAGCSDDDIFNVRNTDSFAEEPFSFEFERKTRTVFRLEGINGKVQLTGMPDISSITVSGERRVGSESVEDARAHLEQLKVEVEESETAITIRTDQPSKAEGRNYEVNYEITLPQDLEIDVDNVNGNVAVQAIHNAVTVDNVNGQIEAEDLAGNATLKLVNGEITASVTLPPEGRLELRVTNGNIDLEIPSGTSAQFSAAVTNGDIETSDLSLKDASSSPHSLTGTLGEGKGTISLFTVNGTISVTGE